MTHRRNVSSAAKAERDLRGVAASVESHSDADAQYRSIFESSIDGLIINDLDGYVVEVNPAFCAMHGYTRDELIGRHPTTFIHPDSHYLLAEYVITVLAGSHFQGRAMDLRRDGSTFPVEVHGAGFTYKGKPHILGIVRDVTAQVAAERREREQEAQYRGIFEATMDALIINDLNGYVAEANPAACRMHGYTHDEFVGLHSPVFIHPDSHPIFADFLATVKAGEVFRTQAQNLRRDGTPFPIEVVGAPLTFRGAPHVLAVVRDITEQVQASQQLEQRVAERTRELSTLLEVSQHVASTLDLEPLLGTILDQLKLSVDFTGAGVLALDGDEFTVLGYRGPLPQEQALNLRFRLTEELGHWQVVHSREPLLVADTLAQLEAGRTTHGDDGGMRTRFDYIRSWMLLPLMHKDLVIGALSVEHSEPNHYTAHDLALAQAIANQAAVAIENARLYTKAQELASLQERQRLARELHDSVTQAVYGLTLYTEAASRQLAAGDTDGVSSYLDEMRDTAREALQEMRLLIFALRPPVLEQEGLAGALRARLEAVEGRAPGLTATLDVQGEQRAPVAVEAALYRIALEALNNALKYAQAHHVQVSLEQTAEATILEIRDDGVGFDPAKVPENGHLGLRGMRERAEHIGTRLEVESTKGHGTRIRVEVRR